MSDTHDRARELRKRLVSPAGGMAADADDVLASALLAERREALADDGWRDIATLPKMQRAIIGRWVFFGTPVWAQSEGHWYEFRDQREWAIKGGSHQLYDEPPTHWRPILEPPPCPTPPASEDTAAPKAAPAQEGG